MYIDYNSRNGSANTDDLRQSQDRDLKCDIWFDEDIDDLFSLLDETPAMEPRSLFRIPHPLPTMTKRRNSELHQQLVHHPKILLKEPVSKWGAPPHVDKEKAKIKSKKSLTRFQMLHHHNEDQQEPVSTVWFDSPQNQHHFEELDSYESFSTTVIQQRKTSQQVKATLKRLWKKK